jgi:hypothetical protein
MKCFNKEFDVALSFAGEDRDYVEKTAEFLVKSGIRVFYDMYEDTNLWGKDLYQHLDDVYQNKAKYTVVFISENYKKKLWTNHELKSAQARAFSENSEYLLPARFDDTEIAGIRKTTGYISLENIMPEDFAKKIITKLGVIEPSEFLPEEITYVIQHIQYFFEDFSEEEIAGCVLYTFQKLKLTTKRERRFLTYLVMHSCRHSFTEDLHEDITLIERASGFNNEEILEILKSLSNLGFEYKIEKSKDGCEEHQNEIETQILHLSFNSRDPQLAMDNLTIFIMIMFMAPMDYRCETCCISALERLDFTDLNEEPDEEFLEVLLDYLTDYYNEEETEHGEK